MPPMPNAAADITLYDWAPSPFCFKVRAILDYKALPYRRVPILGVALWRVLRRGRVGKAPALEIGGEMVVDSTDIAHALERRWPLPAILPADERLRAQCQALEDWADETFYFLGLHYQWIDREGARMVRKLFGRAPWMQVIYWHYARRIRAQVTGQGTGRKTSAHIERDLSRVLDSAAALVEGDGFLLGDTPMLCDFALAGQLHYLSRPPKTQRMLQARPALGRYMARMNSARHVAG
jgi:glutathione S-transferase